MVGCDLFMCYNVDLCMYYDVLEDYNINPG